MGRISERLLFETKAVHTVMCNCNRDGLFKADRISSSHKMQDCHLMLSYLDVLGKTYFFNEKLFLSLSFLMIIIVRATDCTCEFLRLFTDRKRRVVRVTMISCRLVTTRRLRVVCVQLTDGSL